MKILNKKAKANFQLLEKFEAGIVLLGAEIKSIRIGKASLSDSYVRIKDSQANLINCYIGSWKGSDKIQAVSSTRERKLLLHKRQIEYLKGKISGSNLAVIPVAIYIKNNLAKVEIGLAKSKKKYERRDELKKRAIEREVEREVRGKQ